MDRKTFNLVDVTLRYAPTGEKKTPFKDGRAVTLRLLKTGAEMGQLDEAVRVVCRKFCLRPKAVREWFTANLEKRGDGNVRSRGHRQGS